MMKWIAVLLLTLPAFGQSQLGGYPTTSGATSASTINTLTFPGNQSGANVAVANGPDNGTADRHFFDLRSSSDFDVVTGTPVFTKGGFVAGNASPAPGSVTATPSTTGGTLAAGTYYYKVTSVNASGESVGSPEVSAVTTGTTSSVALSWVAVTSATSYKVYRGTAAAGENVYYTTATNSYTDTNAASTAGTVPASPTATPVVMTRGFLRGFGNLSYTVQAKMFVPAAGTTSSYIGFNNAASGTASGTPYSVGFTGTNFVFNNGGTTSTLGTVAANAYYWVTFYVMGGNGYASILSEGTTNGAGTFSLGAVGQMNNMQVGTTGTTDYIGMLRYAAGIPSTGVSSTFTNSTIVPMSDSVANHQTVLTFPIPSNNNTGTTNTYVVLPPSYRYGVDSPWVVYNHGAGEMGNSIFAAVNPVIQALSLAGYVIVSSDYSTIGAQYNRCWGNATCVSDEASLIAQVQSYFHLAPRPYAIGASMGGIVTLNAISHGSLNPKAVALISPVTNLASIYNNGTGVVGSTQPSLAPGIETAYGFTGSANYAAATAGYDPNLTSISSFSSIPYMIWASAADTVVPTATNGQLFANNVNAAGGSATVVATSGDHGDTSNFDPNKVVAFFSGRPVPPLQYGTLYVKTTFNEGSSGAVLNATAPATCTNGCTGTWTADTGYTFVAGGGVTHSAGAIGASQVSAIINTGNANETLRWTINNNGATAYNNQLLFHWTNLQNTLAINFSASSAQVYDISAGTATQLATSNGNYSNGTFVVTINGTAVTVAMQGQPTFTATIPAGSANKTATSAGFSEYTSATPSIWTGFVASSQ